MTDESIPSLDGEELNEKLLQQTVVGSRKRSNYVVATIVAIGGTGFFLAALSSYSGRDFLPLGQPSTLIFVPQGLVIGFYGIAALMLSLYLWSLIAIDFGSGTNRFDKELGILSVSRRGYLKEIKVEIPLKDIKAVKLNIREGINPKRRITLRLQNRKDLPLTGVGKLIPLIQLEKDGAELARFLDVNLEGID